MRELCAEEKNIAGKYGQIGAIRWGGKSSLRFAALVLNIIA